MGIFDRFKKKEATASDHERLSSLGNDPGAWAGLSDDVLIQVLTTKCIEYGISQDPDSIGPLFALYRHGMERLDVSQRQEMLTLYAGMTEQRQGEGHMGLMAFLMADTNPGICSSAALSLSVLYQPHEGNPLGGPEFVVRTLLRQKEGSESQGSALGGVLLLGDRRILPILDDAWDQLGEEARLGLTKAKSGIVTEGLVEFWLRCLEKGCSESVFGSAVAAIARMPAIAQVPFVLDVERVLPAYLDSENPMRMNRQTSFADYLEEIRPRLEVLEHSESEPKLIPKIYEIWEDPERFSELVG